MRRGRRSGCFTIVAVHSTARGPALGGCRLWHYEDSRAAVRDALRLSQAMTLKSAVAGLPLGGGKGVIMAPDPAAADALADREWRVEALRDFGDTVELLGGSYVTAEDVGTSSRDMETIALSTSHVTGLSRRLGGSGDPSPWTALGVQAAIEVCCERVFGTRLLAGRTIAISGLGNVGGRVASACAEAGATLFVSDIDPRKRTLAESLGARWVKPDEALSAPVDVFAPCALGGLLDHESVTRLGAPIVAGAANNQLLEPRHGDALGEAGILYAPDYVINAGGLIQVADELHRDGPDLARARGRVAGIGRRLHEVFEFADTQRISTEAAAELLAERRIAAIGRLRRFYLRP